MGLILYRAHAAISAVSNTPGSASVTPAAAVTGRLAWAAAGAVAGYWYDYLIEEGTDWEAGVGYYNGTTITRPGPSTDPWFKSSSGSLVSFTTAALVACTPNEYTLMHPGPFMPPLAAAFTAASSDATLPTLSNSARNGLLLQTTSISNATDRYRYAYKALPGSGSWEVICRIRGNDYTSNYVGGGLSAIESGTSKIVSLVSFGNTTISSGRYLGVRRGTLTSFGADVAFVAAFERDSYFRIVHDSGANTYAFYWSLDGENWVHFNTMASATGFTTRADRIAISTFNSNTVAVTSNLTVPYWWQSY